MVLNTYLNYRVGYKYKISIYYYMRLEVVIWAHGLNWIGSKSSRAKLDSDFLAKKITAWVGLKVEWTRPNCFIKQKKLTSRD